MVENSLTAQTTNKLGSPEKVAPLSSHQRFISMFDAGDGTGPFGPEYHMSAGWWIDGEIDPARLQQALNATVAHHEILRTTIGEVAGTRLQLIHLPQPVVLSTLDLPTTDPEAAAQELINTVDATPFPPSSAPLLRAFLGSASAQKHVLVVQCHHLSVDAWSLQLLLREIAWRYAGISGEHTPEPPSLTAAQYSEYAQTQTSTSTRAAVDRSAAFWRDELDGAAMTTVETEWPRSAGLAKASLWERFTLPVESTDRVMALARQARVSPFMVFLAAYLICAHRDTRAADLTVPTFAPGRPANDLRHAVGPYFDFLPLRVDITGCADFSAVLAAVRATCLRAYRHEIPFVDIVGAAPGLMAPLAADDQQVFAIQVEQHLVGASEQISSWTVRELRRRVSAPRGGDIPDGGLLTLDIAEGEEIHGTLAVNSNRFSATRTRELIATFTGILDEGTRDPQTPLNPATT